MHKHLFSAILCAAMMVSTGIITGYDRPLAPDKTAALELDTIVPVRFGEWEQIALADIVLPPDTKEIQDAQTVYKAFRDQSGRIVTLVVVHSETTSDSLRLHIPENCYVAQGFAVSEKKTTALDLSGRQVDAVFLSTERGVYREAVSYWLRDGSSFVTAPYQMQFSLFKKSNKNAGKVLVRASTPYAINPPYDLLNKFLVDFDKALDSDDRTILLG